MKNIIKYINLSLKEDRWFVFINLILLILPIILVIVLNSAVQSTTSLIYFSDNKELIFEEYTTYINTYHNTSDPYKLSNISIYKYVMERGLTEYNFIGLTPYGINVTSEFDSVARCFYFLKILFPCYSILLSFLSIEFTYNLCSKGVYKMILQTGNKREEVFKSSVLILLCLYLFYLIIPLIIVLIYLRESFSLNAIYGLVNTVEVKNITNVMFAIYFSLIIFSVITSKFSEMIFLKMKNRFSAYALSFIFTFVLAFLPYLVINNSGLNQYTYESRNIMYSIPLFNLLKQGYLGLTYQNIMIYCVSLIVIALEIILIRKEYRKIGV